MDRGGGGGGGGRGAVGQKWVKSDSSQGFHSSFLINAVLVKTLEDERRNILESIWFILNVSLNRSVSGASN